MKPQSDLPTMETVANSGIEAAASDYVQKRDARMLMLKEEIESKKKLTDLMHGAQLTHYDCHDEDLVVEITMTEKLKVKTATSDEEEEEENLD